jgi:PAS domain S-box-containing protein
MDPDNQPIPAWPEDRAPDLAGLIDLPAIQALMDDFQAFEDIGMAIVDLEGRVLAATGWQDICTKFHRVHSETRRHCIESDTALTAGIVPGEFKLYHCQNHLWDMATPIVVGGRHVGNFFLGQFFFDDEEVDLDTFRAQARQYGFDEEEYLAALGRVPRWSRDKVGRAMAFYARFSGLISELGWRNLQLRQALDEQRRDREHLQLHARLLDAVRESVVASDLEGRILYWGRGAEQLYGYSADETLGQPYRKFAGAIAPPDETAFRRDLLAAGSWQGEHLQRKRNGEVFWTSTFISVVLDDQGRPTGYIGIDQDITDRKRTEQTLRESEKRFQQVAETAEEWIWEMDAEGRYTYSNPVVEHILGYTPGELVGKMHFIDLFAPEVREEIRQAAAERAALKQGFRRKVNPVLHKDGHVVILETTGVPIVDDQGRLVGYRGADNNISEQKVAEERLRASEERFRLLVKNSSDIIGVVDANGVLQYVNDAEKTVSGFTPGEVQGKTIQDLIHPDDLERVLAEFQLAMEFPHQVRRIQCRQRHKTEGWVEVEVTGQSFLNDPAVNGVVINVRDFTDRKRAEDKLRASIEQYQDIAANIPGVIYQLQIARTGGLEIPYMSAGCEALFEWPLADVDYTGLLFGHMHVGDRALFQHSVAAAARAQERWSLEFRILRPNGRPKWLRGSANPRTLPDGTSIWSGVLLDIDDLKQAEEARRESEAFQHRLMNAIPIPVYYRDRKGCYRVFNKAFELFYEKRTEELAGQTVFDVFSRDLADLYHAKDLELLEHPGTQTYESQLENSQGTLRQVVFHKASIADSRGQVVGIIGTIHDITERKESEKKMADQLDELRRWQAVTLGREDRIAELKREVNAHAARLGQPPPYASVEESP